MCLQFSLQNSKKSAFPKPLHPQPRGSQPDESQNLTGPTGSRKLLRANQNHGGKGDTPRLGAGRAYGVVAAGAGVGVGVGVAAGVVFLLVVELSTAGNNGSRGAGVRAGLFIVCSCGRQPWCS